jgi:hypothetical protein
VEFKLTPDEMEAIGIVIDGTVENLNQDILNSIIVNKLNC